MEYGNMTHIEKGMEKHNTHTAIPKRPILSDYCQMGGMALKEQWTSKRKCCIQVTKLSQAY